jgi:hypothetical protein
MKPNVELHIEELVLHGFKPGDRHQIGEAVERELARLLAEQGLPQVQDAEVPRLAGGQLHLSPNDNPDTVGRGLAGNIFQGIRSTNKHHER